MSRATLSVLFTAVLVGSLSAQQPSAVRWFPKPAKGAVTRPWLPLLDTATLTLGRYRLAKGAKDGQSPHAQDEVYYVVSGRAKFTAGGETKVIQAGDSVFVPARVVHRFSDIESNLDLLVFFSKVRLPNGRHGGRTAANRADAPSQRPVSGATLAFSTGLVRTQRGKCRSTTGNRRGSRPTASS